MVLVIIKVSKLRYGLQMHDINVLERFCERQHNLCVSENKTSTTSLKIQSLNKI